MKHVMYITRGVSGPMLKYSWALTLGLYHPCISLSGSTHAWSISIIAIATFEHIFEFLALGCDLHNFAML